MGRSSLCELYLSILSKVKEKQKSLFYGWWVVAAATLENAMGMGFFYYGWNTFFLPLQEEFGWSRTRVSLVSSLSRLEGGLEGPLVGWLIDKVGARKIILVGAFLAGAGYIWVSRINSYWALILAFVILAFGYNAGYSHGTFAVVAKWFIKKRSQALSYVATGNGVGGAIFVPVLAWLIADYGWRRAGLITGLVLWAVTLPVAVFGIKDTPEQRGLLPDGGPARRAKEPAQEAKPAEEVASAGEGELDEVNFTVVEALKTQAFWVFTVAMFFRQCILSSIVIHEIPYLTDIGIPKVQAASVLALMVLVSIPGRLGFGWLGDRMSKKLLLFLCSLLQAVGIFFLIRTRTVSMAYLFVIAYGVGYGGCIPLPAALRGDLFGRTSFATINGVVTVVTMASGMAGPIVAGYLYDTTHSYTLAFYAFMIMVTVSGVLFLLIPKPKPPARVAHARQQPKA